MDHRIDSQLEGATALDDELDAAMKKLDAGFDELLAVVDRGDLMALGPQRLIAFARAFEAHRSRLAVIDVGIAEAAEEERLHEHTAARGTAGALAEILMISPGQARGRVARAEQLRPRSGLSTGACEPELPLVAGAVRDGAITGDQLSVVTQAMQQLRCNPALSPLDLHAAERTLVEHARAFGPLDLRRIATRVYDALVPDGALPREELARARRGLVIGPEQRDGTHTISGTITRTVRAKLHAVLSSFAAPRPADGDHAVDPRTPAQRLHDALEEAADLLLRSGGLPASGGTPATVHLIVDLDRLTDALGTHSSQASSARAVARTALGDDLTLGELLDIAAEAELVPTYCTAAEGIVGYGRTRRIATKHQTNALIARDGGCSFPSCTAPPEWCQRHHVIPWHRGGPTDLGNLTLLCGHHHREFERRGWRVDMVAGLPTWTPPAVLDPKQRPLVNTRVAIRDQGELAELLAGTRRLDALEPEPDDDPPVAVGKKTVAQLISSLAALMPAARQEEARLELDWLTDVWLHGVAAPPPLAAAAA